MSSSDDVAVPFNAVQATNKNNNKWYLVMNASKDALKNAKGFKYDRNAMTWVPEEPMSTPTVTSVTWSWIQIGFSSSRSSASTSK